MSELYEFTVEDMKGCPPFESDFTMNEDFIKVDSDGDVVSEDYENQTYYRKTFKCNPHDRMMAICKHLFELMPQLQRIDRVRGINMKNANISFGEVTFGGVEEGLEIEINPFIGTERTDITREEVYNG